MNEDLFIQKVLKLEEDVAQIKEVMSTKADVRLILDGQDQMMRILRRLDQEQTFTSVHLGRLDEKIKKIDELEKDVKDIKLKLQMV